MNPKSNQAGSTAHRRAILAGLSAGLSLLGTVAVVWGESRHYVSLTDARLEGRVGSKGSCCTPGLKTACSSSGTYVCTNSGVVCDPTATSNDTCGDPNCGDSDTKTDQCDSMNFGTYAVTVTICGTTSSHCCLAMVDCSANSSFHQGQWNTSAAAQPRSVRSRQARLANEPMGRIADGWLKNRTGGNHGSTADVFLRPHDAVRGRHASVPGYVHRNRDGG